MRKSRDSVHTLVQDSAKRIFFTWILFSLVTYFTWLFWIVVYRDLVTDLLVIILLSNLTIITSPRAQHVCLFTSDSSAREVFRVKMACSPNSGSVPVSEDNVELVLTQPNSGLRHDFIGNSAFFSPEYAAPSGNEINLSRDSDVFVTEATIENVDCHHSGSQLPASSSTQASSASAQARPVTVSAGQNNNMADFRSMLINLQQVAATITANVNPGTVSHHADVSQVDCDSDQLDPNAFGDSLDAIVAANDDIPAGFEEAFPNSDIVAQMSDFFAHDEKTGPKISDALAGAVCVGFRSKVSKDKRKTLLEIYARPENCPALKTPRVNKAVWHNMSRGVRDADVASQILQSNVCSVTYPLLTLVDKMNTAKQHNRPIFGNEIQECLKLATDSFKLTQLLYTDITYRRREAIQPHLHQAYKELCR